MNEIKYGLLHNHTMHSIKDSVVRISELVQKAKEFGAPAVALTDHGTMTGCFEFYTDCRKNGIKPILGCELYVKDYSFGGRLHLIVMAKDYQGYQAMMKCVKLSNKRIQKVGTLVFPESNTQILEECFGEGSKGYGHVIATSACINGVIAGLNFQNATLTDKYTLANSKVQKSDYAKEQIAKFEEMIKEYGKVDAPEAKEKIKAIKKNITALKKEILEDDARKELSDSIETLSVLYKDTRDGLLKYMEEEAVRYEKLFGKGNFYIELQNHGMPEEKDFMYQLDLIAERLNIPTCAANDAHMLDNSDTSILARQTITGLRWNNIEEVSASEKEVYIKTDEELINAISAVVGPKRASVAYEGIKSIVDACNVELPENVQHYPVFDKNIDSMKLLVEETKKGIERRFPNGLPEGYRERLNYELKIIKQMNVADYLLIVQDLLKFGRKLGNMPEERYDFLADHIWEMSYDEIIAYVDADQSYFGYTVGPGRGSSAGSLVCFVNGITDIDPMPYNLLFERFLNPERVSMPDIDSDYGNGYREVVIAYTYKKYGDEAVCRITTFGTNSAKAALKNVARAIGGTKMSENEGSGEFIKKHYQDLGAKLAKVCSGKPHDVLSNYNEKWAQMGAEEKEIVERAKSIEGSYSQQGMHACGVIISDNDNVNEYIPLSWDENNSCYKSQCTPTEAEALGLLKMDYLGLKNLNIITEIIRLIEKTRGIRIDPSTIPVESKVIMGICKDGRTNNIFQLESQGMKKLVKQFLPDSFEDITLDIAIYRPGPMDFIPEIIAVKKGLKKPVYITPLLASILDVTYGKPVYQEQIQQIFGILAGYSYGEGDKVRRAMAKKKESVLLAEREAFVYGDETRGIKGCQANGIDPEKANQLFDELVSFASYAFNKSHAAVYARTAYIQMYLKYYYFEEFMTVALKYASDKKIMSYIDECRKNGVKVLPPDINKSGENFTLVNGDILYGLSSIKGIVSVDKIIKARNEKPFTDFKDYIKRGHFKKNVTEALIWAGAFDSISSSRKAISLMVAQLIDANDKILEKEEKIENTREIISVLNKNLDSPKEVTLAALKELGYNGKTVPKIDKKKKDLDGYLRDLESLNEILDIIEEPTNLKDDKDLNLKKEKELLGVYISGHPTQSYTPSAKCVPVAELQGDTKTKIFGAISNLQITQRRKDGANMAIFEIEDTTGSIKTCCFVKEYAQYEKLIKEGNVIEAFCEIDAETVSSDNTDDNGNDGNEEEKVEEIVLTAKVKSISPATKKTRTMMITLSVIVDWDNAINYVLPYEEENGCNLVLWDKSMDELRETTIKVSDRILTDSNLTVTEI